MSKSNKLEAFFKGGDYDGKTTWLDKAYPTLIHLAEWKTQSGELLRSEKAKYKLVTKGPPLRYELSEPN
jgi:hypothetical protein